MAREDCSVYVIAFDGDKGPTKVGIARNPAKRMAALQTAHHQKLVLIGHWEMPNREIARYVEESFHATQAETRLSGEWFDLSPKLCMWLLRVALGTALDAHTSFDADQIEEILAMSRNDRAPNPYDAKGTA